MKQKNVAVIIFVLQNPSLRKIDPVQALKCYSLYQTCLGSLMNQIQLMAKLKESVSYGKGPHVLSFLCSAGNQVCHGEPPDL